MILRVRHVLTFEHDEPVARAASLLRLRPRSLAWQRIRRYALSADPAPTKLRDGVDHFGNPVAWAFHDAPHGRLEFASEVIVELLPRPAPQASPPWEQVAGAMRAEGWAWREAEFTFPSPFAPPLAEVRAFAAPSFPPRRPLCEAAACLARRVGREFRHVPGAPGFQPLARVLADQAGSGRDLAHVVIAGLRAHGVPARAITGYVPAGDEARLHGWVGCWLGPGLGWLDLDPVELDVPMDGRVSLGWGRDHGDVAAAQGILSWTSSLAAHSALRSKQMAVEIAE